MSDAHVTGKWCKDLHCSRCYSATTWQISRIEQLEAQLRTAKVEGMLDATDICKATRKVSGFDEKLCAFNDGCDASAMAIYEAIRAAKEKLQPKEPQS